MSPFCYGQVVVTKPHHVLQVGAGVGCLADKLKCCSCVLVQLHALFPELIFLGLVDFFFGRFTMTLRKWFLTWAQIVVCYSDGSVKCI